MATSVYVVAAVVVLGYAFYLWLHPKPLPGIPYDEKSARRISGNQPDVMESYNQISDFNPYRTDLAKKLGSPVIQLFHPLMSPIVFLDDPRETEDILLRRNKEFDRTPITSLTIGTIMPHCTIVKPTNAHWKAQRKPWTDIMAPDFLRKIVAPGLYDAGKELTELWKAKLERSRGAPVDILRDFDTAALDAIWIAILGEDLGGLRDQISAARGDGEKPSEGREDKASGLDMHNTLNFLNQCALGWRTFTFPPLQLWLLKKGSEYRKFDGIKNQQIDRLMRASIKRFQDAIASGVEAPDRCAMDLVLRREVQAAHKAGTPLRDLVRDVDLRDELFLLLWAGHDTTSNTLSWWIKYMALRPHVQDQLRAALRAAFPGPELPSATEILDADIPYLDGTIEEALRLSGTAPSARYTLTDVEILGRRVPKGTNVIFNHLLDHRPPPAPEELRSPSSRAAFEKRGRRGGVDGPAGDNLEEFNPERWLVEGKDGKPEFDAYAIPRLAFGDGPRGCFVTTLLISTDALPALITGRKLAMHELRIMITLSTLSLKMLPLPDDLANMDVVETMFRKPRDCYAKFELL
ncbi:cytochrome P450 [Xylariales sp. PMI_506]|nr:cytochrome P450 [Xylariales sp. PMI_506]